MTREWDATSYHKVSGPQTGWGQMVLARLDLAGDERAIDAGCGSGRLTAELAERLPHGQVVALDRSWNMLQTARANLRPAYGPRVRFVQVSLPALPFDGVRGRRVQHRDVPLGAPIIPRSSRTSSRRCGRAAACTRSVEAARTSRRHMPWPKR